MTALSKVWPGPVLMVPMTVDCLLVGAPDLARPWSSTRFDFQNLANGRKPDTAPPFRISVTPPGVGAHLMWTLPYGLRQGQQATATDPAGSFNFAFAPNRWMVVRASYTSDQIFPTLTAGIIQSDLLGPIQNPASSQYPSATGPAQQIGGYTPIANWTSPAGPDPLFLTAVAPGDLAWGVAYDNVQNVFSFYDNLTTGTAALTLTYSVIGWYESPLSDPLQQIPVASPEAWMAAILAQFGWTAGTEADVDTAQKEWTGWQATHGINDVTQVGALPTQYQQAIDQWKTWQTDNGCTQNDNPTLPQQTICHGMVQTVAWSGPAATYGSGAPTWSAAQPTVAVGNTSSEAVSAWIAAVVIAEDGGTADDAQNLARSIDALQKGLIFELETDPVSAEFLLHRARFDALNQALTWIVIRPQIEADTVPSAYSGQQTIPLTDAQTLQLTALNNLQTTQNSNLASLATLRQEYYAVTSKLQNMPIDAGETIATQVANARKALSAQLTTLQTSASDTATQLAAAQTSLQQLLGADFSLRLINAPAFFAPTDPSIMIAGANLDSKFADPGIYADGDPLFTRFTGQVIVGLQTTWLGAEGLMATITPADILEYVTALPLGNGIPKEIPDLLLEMLFLDTSFATALADIYFRLIDYSPLPTELAEMATSIRGQQTAWQSASALGISRLATATGAGLIGMLPSPVALEYRTAQPWSPVFLDWKVRWFPTSLDQSEQLVGWELGAIDYEWTGTSITGPAVPIEYSSRTVLNAKIAQDLATQLEAFSNDPEYDTLPVALHQEIQAAATAIAKFDVITQSLGGLTQQFVTRMLSPTQPSVADPLLADADAPFEPIPGGIDSILPLPFFPIRAGHFEIIDVWVVDGFGQILDCKNPDLVSGTPLPNVIVAESASTPNNSTLVQLPPRLSQFARARLTLLDAEDDTIRTSSADSTNPICGWLMTNHLDGALIVFDPTGINMGELLIVDTAAATGQTGVRWDPAPGVYATLGAPPSLPNPHLQAFTSGLLQSGLSLGGGVLQDLLDVMDTSLWQIPLRSATEGALSMLIGRPLAMVRASVSLELYGYPDYNQTWSQTGTLYSQAGVFSPTPTLAPFQSVKLSLRIGDLADSSNGVLGYFLGDDYSTFYSVYGAGTDTASLLTALRQGAPLTTNHATDPSPSATTGYVVANNLIQAATSDGPVVVTLIVDPRGIIPLISGSQPVSTTVLAPGPVTEALHNMKVTFRAGPLLIDPTSIQFPLPAENNAVWSWVTKTDTVTWAAPQSIAMSNAVADMKAQPPVLQEGWLVLSAAADSDPTIS